jgi:hypothetical protein
MDTFPLIVGEKVMRQARPAGIAKVLLGDNPVAGLLVKHAGMGIVVGPRHVLTCAHVVNTAVGQAVHSVAQPEGPAQVVFPFADNDSPVEGKVVVWCPMGAKPVGDVAVIELNADVPPEVGVATFAGDGHALPGNPLMVFGYRAGGESGLHVEARLMGPTGTGSVQIDGVKVTGVFVEGGYSGAAVWDATCGAVIGMVSAKHASPIDRVAFMIPMSSLQKTWPHLNVKSAPATADRTPEPSLPSTTPTPSLTLLLFKAACARAAPGLRPVHYQQYVDDAAITLMERAGAFLPTPLHLAAVENFKHCGLPWQLALVMLSLARVPIFLADKGQPTLANSLRQAMEAFLQSPVDVHLQMLPDCDTLLLDPELAIQSLAEFYTKLFDPELTSSLASASLILQSAAQIVNELQEDLNPLQLALLSIVARIWRAIQAHGGTTSTYGVSLPSVHDLLQQVDRFTVSKSPRERGTFYFHVDGHTITLHTESQVPRSIPVKWEEAAQQIANSYSAPSRLNAPALRSLYIEPMAIDFGGDASSNRHSRLARPLSLQSHVAGWLAYTPDVPLVIVGDPGTGKTSCCRWLVSGFLERWQASGKSPEEYFPLYLPLRDIRSDIPSLQASSIDARGRDLLAILIARMTRLSDVSNKSGPLGQKLLLFLDGFDEMSIISRFEVSAFLDGVTLLARQDKLAIILTGRTIGFEPFWSLLDKQLLGPNRWRRVRLLPFTRGPDGTCERYIRRFLVANSAFGNPLESPGELIAVARDGASFGDMVETPVLLALLCDIFLRHHGLVPPPGQLGWYQSVKWLVEECIKWRANPSEREREELSTREFQRRVTQYGRWAWQAVLSGGTAFVVDDLEGFHESGNDATLVEFFFSTTETRGGNAVFMHRSIAEFLAADYIVERLTDAGKTNAPDLLFDMARTMAQEKLSLEVNFKTLISLRIQEDCTENEKQLIHRAAFEFVDALYFDPGRLHWRNASIPTHRIIGAGAEIGLLFMLASHRDVETRRMTQAIEMRNHSDRRLAAWAFCDAPRTLAGGIINEMALVAFNFFRTNVTRLSANRAVLSSSSFVDSHLELCDFKSADLTSCDFTRALFQDCKFEDAIFKDACIAGARFLRCDLSILQILDCRSLDDCIIEIYGSLMHELTVIRPRDEGLRTVLWSKPDQPGNLYRWTGTYLGLKVSLNTSSDKGVGPPIEAVVRADRPEVGRDIEVWNLGKVVLKGILKRNPTGGFFVLTDDRMDEAEPPLNAGESGRTRESKRTSEQAERMKYINEVCLLVERALDQWKGHG